MTIVEVFIISALLIGLIITTALWLSERQDREYYENKAQELEVLRFNASSCLYKALEELAYREE